MLSFLAPWARGQGWSVGQIQLRGGMQSASPAPPSALSLASEHCHVLMQSGTQVHVIWPTGLPMGLEIDGGEAVTALVVMSHRAGFGLWARG